jgi:hypothetical protein
MLDIKRKRPLVTLSVVAARQLPVPPPPHATTEPASRGSLRLPTGGLSRGARQRSRTAGGRVTRRTALVAVGSRPRSVLRPRRAASARDEGVGVVAGELVDVPWLVAGDLGDGGVDGVRLATRVVRVVLD